MKLVFFGGGKMAEALIGGLINNDWCAPSDLGVVEPSAERRAYLHETFPAVAHVTDSADADVVIAVKPQHVGEVTALLAGSNTRRVLSIAAGVTIAAIQDALPGEVAVIRAMPNTPALVGAGAAAIAAGSYSGEGDVEWARSILTSVGIVEVVDESDIDAVTGLSGSGPAYIFLVAEAMIAAGVAQGLRPEVADRLARQTILGAGMLMGESGEDPAILRANVTSPGGTTAEGIAVLESRDIRDAFEAAVAAATARSVELGSA